MTNPRWLTATLLILACAPLAGGPKAAAQVYNPITNCYEDRAGVAPPFCPNGQGTQPPRPPQDNRPDTWTAIAVSPSTLNWGAVWLRNSDRAAKAGALAECGKRARDCRVAISTFDYCVALATSPSQRLWAAGGPNHAVKDAKAMSVIHCQRAGGRACIVVASACADG